jgi:hypothetical protein
MALDPDALLTELRKFGDPEYSGFVGFPVSGEDAAQKWAHAVRVYATDIVPTLSNPTNALDSAEDAFKQVMEQITLEPPNGFEKFRQAFDVFVEIIELFMSAFWVQTPTEAVGQIDIKTTVEPLGLSGASALEVITEIKDVIDAWFKSGLYTLNNGSNIENWE